MNLERAAWRSCKMGLNLETKIAHGALRFVRGTSVMCLFHARCKWWYEKNAVEAFSSEPEWYIQVSLPC